MDKINRRKFLTLVGVGSGAVAAGAMLSGAMLSGAGLFGGPSGGKSSGTLSFRAVAGLPGGALPSYASYVVQGNVNVAARSGVVTRAVYAGYPGAMSTIALPGLSQVVRVTDVREADGTVDITGVIDDASQLRPREDPVVRLRVDRSRGAAWTRFLGQPVELRLQT